MKIAHLTSVHTSNDVRICHKECVSLVKHGFDVTLVVSGDENREHKGVRILGVGGEASTRLQRMTRTVNKVYDKAVELDSDVYHFHDPELLRIALKLKRRGKKVVYDIHEDVPRQILGKYWLKAGLKKPVSLAFEKYENRIAAQLDFLITATPFIRERFRRINQNVIDINNFPLLEEFPAVEKRTKEDAVCYVGTIQRIRGVWEMVKSLEYVEARLNLGGKYFPPEFRDELCTLKGWARVNEVGFLARDKVAEVLASSRAGLVTIHPMVNYLDSLPVKMFEYMSAGIPVIASDFPLWKEIIEGSDCGICVDPLNPKEIAKAIEYVMENPGQAEVMGANGRKAVEEKYNWDMESNKLVHVYDSLQ